MGFRWLAGAALVVWATTAAPVDGAVTTLLRQGARATDGAVLTSFDELLAATPDGLVFRTSSDAIFVVEDGGPRLVVASGDPLPAPLTGSFGGLRGPVVTESGRIVFYARLRGAEESRGLFAADAGGIVLLTSEVRAPRELLGANDAGQVLYRRNDLLLWSADRGVTEVVARRASVESGRISGILSASLGASGTVAAVVRVRAKPTRTAILRWDAGTLSTVATHPSTPVPSTAVGPDGRIAFTQPAGGDPSVQRAGEPAAPIATVGELVDGAPVTGLRHELVAVDGADRVAIVADLPTGPAVVRADGATLTRLTAAPTGGAIHWARGIADDGGVAWRDEQRVVRALGDVQQIADFETAGETWLPDTVAMSASGILVVGASRDGVYRLRDGAVAPVVRRGDVLDDVGRVETIGTVAAGEGTIGVAVYADDDTRALLVAPRDAPVRPALVEPPDVELPRLDSTSAVFDVGRGRAVLVAEADRGRTELLELRPGRPARRLLATRRSEVSLVDRARDTTLLGTTVGNDRGALRVLDQGRLRTLARVRRPDDEFPFALNASQGIVALRLAGPDIGSRTYTIESFGSGRARVLARFGVGEDVHGLGVDGRDVVALTGAAPGYETRLVRLDTRAQRTTLLAPGDVVPELGVVAAITSVGPIPMLEEGATVAIRLEGGDTAIVAVPVR